MVFVSLSVLLYGRVSGLRKYNQVIETSYCNCTSIDTLTLSANILANKPEVLVLSKCDTAPADYLDEVRDALQAAGAGTVLYMSSVSHDGVSAVLRAVASLIEDSKVEAAQALDPLSWTPHEQG